MDRHPSGDASILVCLLSILAFAPDASAESSWGSRGVRDGQFETPLAVAADAEFVFVADFGNHRIQKFTRSGELVLRWGAPGRGEGEFDGPAAIAVDRLGQVFVSDLYNHRIQKFSGEGVFLGQWGGAGDGEGEFRAAFGLAIDRDGVVYVSDVERHRVQKFSNSGAFLGTWGSRGTDPGEFRDPWGVAVDDEGRVLVADHGNDRIQVFSSDGELLDAWRTAGLRGPMGIAAAQGSVVLTDLAGRRVLRCTAAGVVSGEWLERGRQDGVTGALYGLATDPGGRAMVADGARHRVTALTSADFGSPRALGPLPTRFAMAPVRPNPARGVALLAFDIPVRGRLTVDIFSVDGRRVRTLRDGATEPGELRLVWNGRADGDRSAPAGIYFARGRFDDGTRSTSTQRRIVMLH